MAGRVPWPLGRGTLLSVEMTYESKPGSHSPSMWVTVYAGLRAASRMSEVSPNVHQ